MIYVLIAIVGVLVGAGIALVLRGRMASEKVQSSEARAAKLLEDAEREAERTRLLSASEGKEEVATMRREAEDEARTRREEAQRRDERLASKEETIDRKLAEAEKRETAMNAREQDLDAGQKALEQAAGIQRRELERVSQMTAAEAKDQLMKHIVDDAKRQSMATVRELEQRAREEGEERARKIVTIAIQRVASEQTSESTVSVFALPSEEMKGRIIGREGRNIRAFESVTGVNFVIDDTPEAVVLSCFDPVRREIGRLTLEKLVADGRIHPARIEEVYERSQADIAEEIKRAGEAALEEVGIPDAHPEMIKVLGQLKYRTSYGQNVLKHLVESAHIAAGLAAELGLDPTLPKRCAMFHDIGKALTHEVEGSHAIIGAELARRLKESPEVVHAIESHHGEVEQRTIEAVIAQTADQISGGRPGARRESLETYVKRLERLEEIAEAHAGVEKVFAMQAGRDVRVMVKPEDVDDVSAQVLARDIAKQIEEELQYPGQIKITVVREIRAVEFAK